MSLLVERATKKNSPQARTFCTGHPVRVPAPWTAVVKILKWYIYIYIYNSSVRRSLCLQLKGGPLCKAIRYHLDGHISCNVGRSLRPYRVWILIGIGQAIVSIITTPLRGTWPSFPSEFSQFSHSTNDEAVKRADEENEPHLQNLTAQSSGTRCWLELIDNLKSPPFFQPLDVIARPH